MSRSGRTAADETSRISARVELHLAMEPRNDQMSVEVDLIAHFNNLNLVFWKAIGLVKFGSEMKNVSLHWFIYHRKNWKNFRVLNQRKDRSL